MTNYNRLYTLDPDTLEYMNSIDNNKKSETVRAALKLYKHSKSVTDTTPKKKIEVIIRRLD